MTSNEEFDEAELQALRAAAQALPREIAPNAAAWTNIRTRIEQTRVRELPTATGFDANADTSAASGTEANAIDTAAGSSRASAIRPFGHSAIRPFSHSAIRPFAALIAATLFIAVTTLVVRQQGPIETAQTSPYAADTGRADMAGVFARYDGAATDLVNHLQQRRTLLNPATVAVLDSALFTIDEAIRETRDALRDAPDNATIAGLLEVTYQQKLDLLRRASELSEGSFQE